MEGMAPGAIVPELLLLAGAVVGLVAGLFLPRGRQWLVAVGSAVTLAAVTVVAATQLPAAPRLVFDGSYAVDTATGVARVVIGASALLVAGLSAERFAGHSREAEFYVLLLFASLGAVVLAGASDLMLVVVGYLLASVPVYALAGFAKDAPGTEAAMKYFLVGALLGAVMLYGFAWLYGAGGATAYAPLRAGLSPALDGAVVVGVLAGLMGLGFKMGAVPGHFWVPDVAEGAPAPVAAYVTTVPKVAGLVAVARLLGTVVPETAVDWRLLVALVAAASMTLGNLAAFWQDNARRLLGYSTISQVGYLLMAVVAVGRSELAVPGLLYFAAAYAVANLGAFAVVVELPEAATLDDYAGLSRRHPALALTLTVCLLSLVGVPPLGGFVGKLVVFAAAWDGGYAWLVVVAAANTVASLFYYLRWITPAYVGPAGVAEPSQPDALATAGRWGAIGGYLAGLAVLAIGVAGRLLLDVAAGTSLLGG